MKTLFSFLALIFTQITLAQPLDQILPNNTGTQLAAQGSADGRVLVRNAYVSKHLYGQELILTLELQGLEHEKEIWFYDRTQRRAQQVYFVSDESVFGSGGSHALWLGGAAGQQEWVVLKISGVSVASWNGEVPFHAFDLFIKTRQGQFENRGIQIRRR